MGKKIQETNLFNFDFPFYKITKPIRLIELFGGVGSQAKALKNIGANFEHYKLVDKIKANADKIIFYCFENGKLKIEGESSFETTICEKTTDEYSFVLSHLNVKKLLASASGKIIFYYSGDKKPILFVEKSNEILLLPIARKTEEK